MENLSIENISEGCTFELLLNYEAGKMLSNGEEDPNFSRLQGKAKVSRKEFGGSICIEFINQNFGKEVVLGDIIISPKFSYINEGGDETACANFEAPVSQNEYVSFVEFTRNYTSQDGQLAIMIFKEYLLTDDKLLIIFTE